MVYLYNTVNDYAIDGTRKTVKILSLFNNEGGGIKYIFKSSCCRGWYLN